MTHQLRELFKQLVSKEQKGYTLNSEKAEIKEISNPYPKVVDNDKVTTQKDG